MRRSWAKRRAEARVGLSSAHISTHSWAEVTPEGSFLAVHIGRKQACPVPPTTRGAVHGFSRQSRSRLLKTVAKIDRAASARALFVTLTYPLSSGTDFTTCKRHLNAWSMRFKRRYAHGSFVWRLELQKNGSPHFHLLVYGVPFMPHEWVANSWFEVVASGNEFHLKAGTEVRRVVSAKAALSYAAKYVAKLPESEDVATEGRVWGVIGRRNIPIRVISWELEPESEARLSRIVHDMASRRSRHDKPPEHPIRWVIVSGDRGVRIVQWACGLTP
jgi:hypothetical protein